MDGNSQKHPQLKYVIFLYFFLSGGFALIYEVAWVRAITLEFGSTTLAVSTIVSLFMGGLALGAWLVSKRIDFWKGSLLKYGIIEILIGVYALMTPFLFEFILPVFINIAAQKADSIWAIAVVRFFATILLLLLPSTLMGATLPLLSRFYAYFIGEGSKGGGILYGLNTVGAFSGTVLAGFVLLPRFGLNRSLYTIAILNIIMGVIVVYSARIFEKNVSEISHKLSDGSGNLSLFEKKWPVLAAIALTGFAAMACEIIWTRILILIIGGSVYAFSIVLAVFLLAIGLGAWLAAILFDQNIYKNLKTFYYLALASAALIFLSGTLMQFLPALFLNYFWDWKLLQYPHLIFYLQILISGLVIFIPALIMGTLFPLAAKLLILEQSKTGSRIANIYTYNTIGSILGSFCAGFVLIPLIGIRGSVLVTMVLYCCAAFILWFGSPLRQKNKYGFIDGLFLLICLVIFNPRWDKQLMTSAMYNYSYFLPKLTTGRLKSSLYNRYKLLFYKDGLTATVTVTRNVRVEHQPLGITINGKYDGSSHEDMENQRLLAHVPLLFHPNPQKVAVVGMGTGCTAGSASLYGIDKLTVIEIEPAVIEGARLFTEYNHDVLNNPKVAFKTTDARLFFRLNADPYDVIISEPSNPWLAGPSDLFTLEFFQLTANSMKENALFCQWIQLYALSPENVKTIICTFTKVFPYTYLISSSLDNEILLLGAKTEFYPDILAARKRMEQKEIREDLADPNVDILNIFDLAARFRLGPKEIQQLVEEGAVNTDDLPVVAYQAPKELYIRTNEENMTLLSRFSKGIAPYIQKKFDSGVYKKDFFLSLAEAYRRYLKNSMEAIIAEECAGKVD